MLVLSRRKGEFIDIDGGKIVVSIADIRKGPDGRYVARLGIEAPREILINRREVSEAIAANGPERDQLAMPLDLERH
jgi:carbon storage regulator CsrA